ncbi:Myb-like DNA-binding domain protein [Quaeritorhiza haematococci]|nr:Myb-like DNA-binding domain protein [Quaeritorhiza haematococci]
MSSNVFPASAAQHQLQHPPHILNETLHSHPATSANSLEFTPHLPETLPTFPTMDVGNVTSWTLMEFGMDDTSSSPYTDPSTASKLDDLGLGLLHRHHHHQQQTNAAAGTIQWSSSPSSSQPSSVPPHQSFDQFHQFAFGPHSRSTTASSTSTTTTTNLTSHMDDLEDVMEKYLNHEPMEEVKMEDVEPFSPSTSSSNGADASSVANHLQPAFPTTTSSTTCAEFAASSPINSPSTSLATRETSPSSSKVVGDMIAGGEGGTRRVSDLEKKLRESESRLASVMATMEAQQKLIQETLLKYNVLQTTFFEKEHGFHAQLVATQHQISQKNSQIKVLEYQLNQTRAALARIRGDGNDHEEPVASLVDHDGSFAGLSATVESPPSLPASPPISTASLSLSEASSASSSKKFSSPSASPASVATEPSVSTPSVNSPPPPAHPPTAPSLSRSLPKSATTTPVTDTTVPPPVSVMIPNKRLREDPTSAFPGVFSLDYLSDPCTSPLFHPETYTPAFAHPCVFPPPSDQFYPAAPHMLPAPVVVHPEKKRALEFPQFQHPPQTQLDYSPIHMVLTSMHEQQLIPLAAAATASTGLLPVLTTTPEPVTSPNQSAVAGPLLGEIAVTTTPTTTTTFNLPIPVPLPLASRTNLLLEQAMSLSDLVSGSDAGDQTRIEIGTHDVDDTLSNNGTTEISSGGQTASNPSTPASSPETQTVTELGERKIMATAPSETRSSAPPAVIAPVPIAPALPGLKSAFLFPTTKPLNGPTKLKVLSASASPSPSLPAPASSQSTSPAALLSHLPIGTTSSSTTPAPAPVSPHPSRKPLNKPATYNKWTTHEDDLLRAAVAKHGANGKWALVASLVPGRTPIQCSTRWMGALNPKIHKGKWSKDEDEMLKEAYEEFAAKAKVAAKGRNNNNSGREDDGDGTTDPEDEDSSSGSGRNSSTTLNIPWNKIAERIPGRTPVQCIARYQEALDPAVRKGKWSPEEDSLLKEGLTLYGKCWVKIAEMVPRRTQRQCRTRWLQLKAKLEKEEGGLEALMGTEEKEDSGMAGDEDGVDGVEVPAINYKNSINTNNSKATAKTTKSAGTRRSTNTTTTRRRKSSIASSSSSLTPVSPSAPSSTTSPIIKMERYVPILPNSPGPSKRS